MDINLFLSHLGFIGIFFFLGYLFGKYELSRKIEKRLKKFFNIISK